MDINILVIIISQESKDVTKAFKFSNQSILK